MIKSFKIIIPLLIISFLFSSNSVLADSCDELKPILEKYYKASQEENIDNYMKVMDVDYLKENLLDNYEDYAKAAWEVYDTKEYKLDLYNCKMEGSDALAYLNVKTTLVSKGEEVETQRNYVALFHKLDSWKIRYVMDEDVFSQFQSSLHTQLLLDAMKEEINKTASDTEAVLEYAQIEEELLASDYDDTITDGVTPRKGVEETNTKSGDEDGGHGFLYFLLLVILSAGGYFYYQKNKK